MLNATPDQSYKSKICSLVCLTLTLPVALVLPTCLTITCLSARLKKFCLNQLAFSFSVRFVSLTSLMSTTAYVFDTPNTDCTLCTPLSILTSL